MIDTSHPRQGDTMGYGSEPHWEKLELEPTAVTELATASLLLTIAEAATALRISRSSVYRLFESGDLSWVRVRGKRRVSTAEIHRFIAAHTEVA
jgi:excisionase family DNA binding protein